MGLEQLRVLTNRPRRIPSVDAYGLNVVEQLLVSPGGELTRTAPQQSQAAK
jgi:GTP cyclohydrolase II